jgi:hypothetical protein
MDPFFSVDLEFGNRIQRRVLEGMRGVSVFREMSGFFPFWDVVAVRNGRIELLEFKSDRIGWATGNLAIEFVHGGKKSGFLTTQADRWIYTLVSPDERALEIYDIPVSVLKEKVGLQEYDTIKSTESGQSACYIFPKAVFAAFRMGSEVGTCLESSGGGSGWGC